jgi:hypothetical protein
MCQKQFGSVINWIIPPPPVDQNSRNLKVEFYADYDQNSKKFRLTEKVIDGSDFKGRQITISDKKVITIRHFDTTRKRLGYELRIDKDGTVHQHRNILKFGNHFKTQQVFRGISLETVKLHLQKLEEQILDNQQQALESKLVE